MKNVTLGIMQHLYGQKQYFRSDVLASICSSDLFRKIHLVRLDAIDVVLRGMLDLIAHWAKTYAITVSFRAM